MQKMWPTGVALTDDDRVRIDALALRFHCSRSEMIRRLIRAPALSLVESTTTESPIVVVKPGNLA